MTIQEYLIKLCHHVGLTEDEFSVEIKEDDELIAVRLELPENESGLFIGYHGETLQSIQRVVRVSFYDEIGDKLFKLNVNDYRQQREEYLVEKTIKIAQRVQETGEPYTFPYLTTYDRYLVHSTISDNSDLSDVVSESEGEGRYRYLTIRLQETNRPVAK